MRVEDRKVYIADDGKEFDTPEEAINHDVLCCRVQDIKALLPALPKKMQHTGCAFANGYGYLQHDLATLRKAKEMFAELLKEKAGNNKEVMIYLKDWLERDIVTNYIYSLASDGPLYEIIEVFMNTAIDTGRQYGQVYYRNHPAEVDPNIQLNKTIVKYKEEI